jgi:general secretion pathway protein C
MNMSKLSNAGMISIVIKLLILLAVAKAIALGLWWFLPSDGIDVKNETNFKPPYQRVDFRNMLSSSIATTMSSTVTIEQNDGISITNMLLSGLYGNKTKGFVIVALKSNPKKTSIVSVGENYAGYILKTILSDRVVFRKLGKDFVLKMNRKKLVRGANFSSVITHVASTSVHNVERQDIRYYERNPNQLWKDISIMEIKDGNRLGGFKVTRVRKNSKMDKLGLQKGDIIIRANNVDLTSYKSAFDLYNNINKLKTVQIVVLRNNEEKELVYEIH